MSLILIMLLALFPTIKQEVIMITIVNLRNVQFNKGIDRLSEIGIEYVGRPNVIGNPFKGDRAKAIRDFRVWLYEQIRNRDPEVIAELKRLKAIATKGSLVLGCWCAPKPCHADVIKSCIEWAISKTK
jgi:hypothetical protein